jgi:hypothetical protein
VAQAVSLCFSDPLYGIANKFMNTTTDTHPVEGSSTASVPVSTTVYLYWDGTFYYRMNLTAPFVTVSSYARQMPKPPISKIGREDVVDWSVIFVLAFLSAIGFILLLQHVMGRNLKVIRALYRWQLWYFQPTRFDWDEMMSDSEAADNLREEYSFGEDAIPLSMGGRKVGNTVASVFKSGSSHSINQRGVDWFEVNHYDSDDDRNIDDGSALIEMEMVDRSYHRTTSDNHQNGNSVDRTFEKGISFHSDVSFHDDTAVTDLNTDGNNVVRLLRDPNLVDLPDLTSSSKVAIPVSAQLQVI